MSYLTQFERRALEQVQREAEFDRLRREREANGPTPLEIAQQRIVELEEQRDAVYRDAAEWIAYFQTYFPGAVGLHQVSNGIEKLFEQRNSLTEALTLAMADHRGWHIVAHDALAKVAVAS